MKTKILTACGSPCPVEDWCARSLYAWRKAGKTPRHIVEHNCSIEATHTRVRVTCSGYIPLGKMEVEYE